MNNIETELNELLEVAKEALANILNNKNRLEKHGTYTWLKETIGRHLIKSSRHAQTHYCHVVEHDANIDGENHIDLAITRILMAKALEKRQKHE